MKVRTSVHEVKSTIKGITLSSGGFIELELDEGGSGYLKVHVSKSDKPYWDAIGAWRWIQHGDDKKNIKLLTEIRDGADAILESLES